MVRLSRNGRDGAGEEEGTDMALDMTMDTAMPSSAMALPGGGQAAGEALRRAEAARSAMARLLAVAGHDLKQPLQVALMAIECAVSDGVAPRAATRLGMASDALLRLGRELDDLARTSQAGEAVPHLGPVPLGPLLATVAEEWRALADVRGIALRVHPTGACAATDATMLATILRNLVGNAVKYGRTGGRVVIGCRRRGRRLAIEVHDDGAGIASERLATIFEAFDRAGRRDGAGLRLGLHIVRQTAQALRAPVRVASVLGRGTVFGVTLPRAEPRSKDAYDA